MHLSQIKSVCTSVNQIKLQSTKFNESIITPKGVPHLAMCNARATHEVPSSKLKEQPPHRKIGVTSNLPVGRISVVTLIRTDTTLDHSQKAEKVWEDVESKSGSTFQIFSIKCFLFAHVTQIKNST